MIELLLSPEKVMFPGGLITLLTFHFEALANIDVLKLEGEAFTH